MQEYFDRAIRDERHFRTAVAYIEHNPVQAGLCEAPEDWPWSSLGARLSGPPETNLGARASSPPKAEGSQGSDAGRMPALPGVAFEVFEPKVDSEVRSGTVTRAKATCLCCGAVLPPDRVRAQLAAQKGGADVIFDAEGRRTGGARMTAVVTLKPGQVGRHYRLPTDADYAAVRNAQERVARILEEWERGGKQGMCPIPDEPLPPIGTLGFRVQRYGMLQWGDLFTARQKAALVGLGTQMRSAFPGIREVGSMALSRLADKNASLAVWNQIGEKIEHVFGRQALPIVWDFAEVPIFSKSTGNYLSGIELVAKVIDACSSSSIGQIQPADATDHPLPDQSAGVWFTDPPYYDAIPYADLSDFFLVWLKRTLPGHPLLRDPFDPDNPLSPKQQEAVQDETRHAADQRNDGGTRVSDPLMASADQRLIPGAQASSLHHADKMPALPDAAGDVRAADRMSASPSSVADTGGTPVSDPHGVSTDEARQTEEGRPKDRAWFEETMAKAFAEGRRVLAEDGVGSVVFAHKTTEGWEALLSGLIRGGWTITGSWPIATERPGRLRSQESAALATSVHLICRPRPDDAPVGEWAEVLRELPLRVGDWMERLQAEGVRGADLVFACIGPALEIFSRYRSVETAEGREVELPEYLEKVWEVVGRAALEQVLGTAEAKARNGLAGALEEDARLTALFLWTLQSTGEGTPSANDSETEEDNGEGEEDDEAPRRKAAGFSLPFDVVRRFAQPLGIHLDHWEGRIVETSQGVVRLMSVAERSRQLFGEDGTGAAADWFERDPNADLQQALFPEPDAAPQTRNRRRGKQATLDAEFQTPDATTLDRVHAAMLLQAGGYANALRTLITSEQERGPDFLRLANALSALYPHGSREKRLLDAMLLAAPR